MSVLPVEHAQQDMKEMVKSALVSIVDFASVPYVLSGVLLINKYCFVLQISMSVILQMSAERTRFASIQRDHLSAGVLQGTRKFQMNVKVGEGSFPVVALSKHPKLHACDVGCTLNTACPFKLVFMQSILIFAITIISFD